MVSSVRTAPGCVGLRSRSCAEDGGRSTSSARARAQARLSVTVAQPVSRPHDTTRSRAARHRRALPARARDRMTQHVPGLRVTDPQFLHELEVGSGISREVIAKAGLYVTTDP